MKILNYDLDTYAGLIFDLDGTLLNSMPMHNKAWMDTFKQFGLEIPQSLLDETMGMASQRIVHIANERYGTQLDAPTVARAKRDRYLQVLDQVEVVKDVHAILDKYFGKKPLGVVTGGSHEVVDQLLPKLDLAKYFDAVVCADDTVLGKDSTEPYALVGKKLGVDPTQCLFFDDGDVGLKGAALAGMDVVHVDISQENIFIK